MQCDTLLMACGGERMWRFMVILGTGNVGEGKAQATVEAG